MAPVRLTACPLCGGAALALAPRFTPAETARMLRDEGVSVFTGVPAMMAKMLDWSRETGTPLTAPRLRLMTVAGSPMTPSLKAEAEAAFGLPLDNGYGLTECAPTVAQTRTGERRSDCAVGHPIPGVEVRIVGPGGVAVPPLTHAILVLPEPMSTTNELSLNAVGCADFSA